MNSLVHYYTYVHKPTYTQRVIQLLGGIFALKPFDGLSWAIHNP